MIPIFAYRKLYPALKEHRQVEKEVYRLLAALLEPRYRKQILPGLFRAPLEYAQRNFFSILFLSIYRAVGIPPEKRLAYGIINHCLRGIVTGADNLLDDEYKELLPLNFPPAATRFKSVMHLLLFDRILFQNCSNMAAQGQITPAQKEALQDRLFQAIVPIGAEEAQEEGGIKEIIAPAEVLKTVHVYKGGKLLCLAFIAPLFLENSRRDQLSLADSGIFSIGIALQLIDDLTDFHEDILAANHNYLVSAIFHNGSTQEKSHLTRIMGEKDCSAPVEQTFPDIIRQVTREAVSEAVYGFEQLRTAGFWFDRQQAYELIRHLFELRGVKYLLPLFPAFHECQERLLC